MYDDYHDYGNVSSQEDVDKLVERNIKIVKDLKNEMSEEDFYRAVAIVFVLAKRQELSIVEYKTMIKDYDFVMRLSESKREDHMNVLKSSISDLAEAGYLFGAKMLQKGAVLSKKFQAQKAVKAKLANDPKQTSKAFVKECWQVWQEKPERYKGKADFARDMLSKCEHLKSQKKIEDWCREWKKEIVTQLAECAFI